MDFKYLGSSTGLMINQDMPLSLQYVFKMVSFFISNSDRIGDEVNPILEYMNSCRRPFKLGFDEETGLGFLLNIIKFVNT